MSVLTGDRVNKINAIVALLLVAAVTLPFAIPFAALWLDWRKDWK